MDGPAGRHGRSTMGIVVGLQDVLQRSLREVVERTLTRRFGPLPRIALSRLAEIRSAEGLARLGERAIRARSLAELGLA